MRSRALLGAVAAVALCVALVVGLVLWTGGEESRVRIEPSDALLDAPLRFEVDGVEDRARARLTLSATAGDGVRWTGTRVVTADGEGSISFDGGTLLASLDPTGPKAEAREVGLFFPAGEKLELRLTAVEGDRVVGTARAARRLVADGVSSHELTLAETGFAGRFWRGHRPVALLLLGGSEGGMRLGPGEPLLASHGYPVLRLAYFREPGLPNELRNIPLEYFVTALTWLREEADARPSSCSASRAAPSWR